MLALIPARIGSKRLEGKNFRDLGGKQLWRWTYDSAMATREFEDVVLCTDATDRYAGLSVFRRRIVPDNQPDIEWVRDFLDYVDAEPEDEFCLLRPTSPFRNAQTIRRALEQWNACKGSLDSLRAVRRATEPAWKQWQPVMELGEPVAVKDGVTFYDSKLPEYPKMVPIANPTFKTSSRDGEHYHSRPTQKLTPSYIQTGALEMFWGKTIRAGTLAGERVGMFLTEGAEAVNIDSQRDWEDAERYLARRKEAEELWDLGVLSEPPHA